MKPVSSAGAMADSTATSTDDEAVVAAFDTVLEAELARGRLESEGIGARLHDGNTVGVAQHLSLAVGGVKVAVARSDFEAAQAILNAPPQAIEDEDEDEEEPVAPLTGDQYANRALRSAVIGLVFFPPIGHLWSLVLLKAAWSRGGLSDKGKRQAAIAAVIDGGAIALAAWIIATVM